MRDNCCVLCKGPHGICLSRGQCDHHKAAQAQDEANHKARRTHLDRTAEQAIANVMREHRAKPKAPKQGPFSYPKEGQ